jgi:hypothetical protein
MKSAQNNDLVKIFAGNPWQAGMVRSLLENAEINSFLKDEIIGNLYPWYTGAGGTASVSVFVASSDYTNAKIVVEEYEKNLLEQDSPPDDRD